MTIDRPVTYAELRKLADLGNRELAAQRVTDRRWSVDPNGCLILEKKG